MIPRQKRRKLVKFEKMLFGEEFKNKDLQQQNGQSWEVVNPAIVKTIIALQ
jgi:hypothetical protein